MDVGIRTRADQLEDMTKIIDALELQRMICSEEDRQTIEYALVRWRLERSQEAEGRVA